jgi:hypothetical protein
MHREPQFPLPQVAYRHGTDSLPVDLTCVLFLVNLKLNWILTPDRLCRHVVYLILETKSEVTMHTVLKFNAYRESVWFTTIGVWSWGRFDKSHLDLLYRSKDRWHKIFGTWST